MIRPMIAVLAAVLLLASPVEAARRTPRIKGTGETLSLQAFQKKHGFSESQSRALLAAVGRIRCPWGIGTAFLLASSDVFVTSGHLFTELDPNSKWRGTSRGSPKRCSYFPLVGAGRYRIAVGSLLQGASVDRHIDQLYRSDWAVGRLDRPVEGASAFQPGSLDLSKGNPVIAVSQGMNDFVTRICMGAVDGVEQQPHLLNWSMSLVSGFTTTCDTGPGASGGPVLAAAPAGTTPAVIGLTMGWVGDSPSNAHHVVLPIERDVIIAVARSMRAPARVLDLANFYKDAPGPPAQMQEIARGLYRIASAGGSPEAAYWLGTLHFNTSSILPNDEIAAFGWLDLAMATLPAGHPFRPDAQIKLRQLATRLDSAQQAAGRVRVQAVLDSGQ